MERSNTLQRIEKWLLREACKGILPSSMLNRKKLKFSEGAGSADVMAKKTRAKITPEEFEKNKRVAQDLVLRSPEELYYYRIWREVMGPNISPLLVGRTSDRTAAA